VRGAGRDLSCDGLPVANVPAENRHADPAAWPLPGPFGSL